MKRLIFLFLFILINLISYSQVECSAYTQKTYDYFNDKWRKIFVDFVLLSNKNKTQIVGINGIKYDIENEITICISIKNIHAKMENYENIYFKFIGVSNSEVIMFTGISRDVKTGLYLFSAKISSASQIYKFRGELLERIYMDNSYNLGLNVNTLRSKVFRDSIKCLY